VKKSGRRKTGLGLGRGLVHGPEPEPGFFVILRREDAEGPLAEIAVLRFAQDDKVNYTTRMSTAPVAAPKPEWSRLVTDSLKQNGVWHTWYKLAEARQAYPDDLPLRGYSEIVRNEIVRELLQHPKGLQAVPRLSPEFLTNFDRFNLNAQEGFLVSLIDGRLDIQKLVLLSPFDQFTTLFVLAKLAHERAITVPQ